MHSNTQLGPPVIAEMLKQHAACCILRHLLGLGEAREFGSDAAGVDGAVRRGDDHRRVLGVRLAGVGAR